MTYLDKLKESTNFTRTENDAVTLKNSLNPLVNLFALGGAYRKREVSDIISLFSKAFSSNRNDAMKILFYLRDIRSGQGERRFFREALHHVLMKMPLDNEQLNSIFNLIEEMGRYDDLYICIGTPAEESIFQIMNNKLMDDLRSEYPSLLAKWIKTKDASSTHSKLQAEITRKHFGMTNKIFRKTISLLRHRIDILETHLSNKEYDFDYSKVPSRAMLQYKKAFMRNDKVRYTKYLEALEKNDNVKINATTLYPYDIVDKILKRDEDKVLNSLWKALPNYIPEDDNSIVVADVSGSMNGLPMSVSISLAIYMAERNKGPYHNHFITFSKEPALQQVQGIDIIDKVRNLSRANWSLNTDFQKVFDLLLRTAINNDISPDEMIKTIYIVSDMEFDAASGRNYYSYHKKRPEKTNFEQIKAKYNQAGYKMPQLVFWNVDARQDQSPVKHNEDGVCLVSGCSPSIFSQAVKGLTPEQFMRQIIDNERYNKIQLFK